MMTLLMTQVVNVNTLHLSNWLKFLLITNVGNLKSYTIYLNDLQLDNPNFYWLYLIF